MKTMLLKSLLLTCTAIGLVGCGDSTTNITELPVTPAPVDTGNDHDHDHDEDVIKGRLAIASADQAVVHIYDLNDNTLVESINTTHPTEYLFSSPENRYAAAVARSQNTIEFIDSGIWQEPHGDHFHLREDAPSLTGFSLHDVRPSHYVPHEDQAAIFFDGDKDSGVNAKLVLIDDESIGAQKVMADHHFDTYMHGTAVIRDQYVLTTLRDPAMEDGTLPEQVAVMERHDDHFHQEQVIETTCPALHGSYQTENHIAFACQDGILTIEQAGDVFTASKILYPADMLAENRVWAIKGSEHSDTMLGLTGAGIFVIDPINQTLSRFERPVEEDSYYPKFGLDGHHEHFLLLDKHGHLNAYSAEDNWQLEHSIPVFDSIDVADKPALIASKSEEVVYIVHQQKVTTVDLHEGKVVNEFELDFNHVVSAYSSAWLGLASEEEHEH